MKKIVKFAVAASLFAALFTGCKKSHEGKFILGLDASFPPMGYTESDGTIVGYDIDLAKEVCHRLGLEFTAKPIDWNAKEMELDSGSIDCIWNGFTMSEDRIASMAFTKAYLNNDQILVARNDGKISSLKDAAGKVVGCQSGSSAEDAIKHNEAFAKSLKEIKYYEDNLVALSDLEVGGIDGVVMDSVVAEYEIKASQKPLVVISDSLAKEAYGIGFKKDEQGTALRDKVWKTLEEMAADGTVARISNQWFGKDISVIGK